MVYKNGAGPHAREGASFAERDRPQVTVVANASEDEVATRRRFARCRRARSAKFVGPFGGGGRGSVVNDDFVAASAFQMSCHGKPHDAQPKKATLLNSRLLSAFAPKISADYSRQACRRQL